MIKADVYKSARLCVRPSDVDFHGHSLDDDEFASLTLEPESAAEEAEASKQTNLEGNRKREHLKGNKFVNWKT